MATTSTPIAAPPAAAATAATATPTSTPTTTPVTAPVVDGNRGEGALNSADAITAMVSAAQEKGFGGETTQTPPAAEPIPAASSQTEAAKPAASETPAVEKPAATDDQHTYSLDVDGFVGAKDLAAKLEANPALKAALPEDMRNEIMANARLAERGSAYEQMFASPNEAKIIAQTAEQFASFSEAFNLVSSDAEKGTTAFINKLIEADALRDKDGNPVKDDKGFFRTYGTANKVVETIAKRWINRFIVQNIEGKKDENLQAALDLVMESAGLRASTADKTENQDPALVARATELDQREASLKQEREADRTRRTTEYSTALDGDLASLYDTETASLLKLATGLDEFTKGAVERELETAIRDGIKKSVAYKERRRAIRQQEMSPERRLQEVTLAREWFRDNLARVAGPIFTKAGLTVKGKVADTAAAKAARAENARSEVQGSKSVANGQTPEAQQTPEQQIAAAREAYKAQNGGKDPSDSELRIYMMLAKAKSAGFAA